MYVNYEQNGEARLGFLADGVLRRLSGGPTDCLVREGFPGVPPEAPVVEGPRRLLPAVLAPGKIICLLRSYRAHAEELGNVAPPEPMFFAKMGNTLIGAGDAIRIPYDLEGEVHHEGELAVVIGKGGRRIAPEDGLAHIAAFTVANDVTARTMQKADAGRGMPWLRGKSLDTFLPLGPGLVPAAAVADPHALSLTVKVNGQVRQEGNTARLLWPLGTIVAHVSRWISLSPGDLVLTGTPEGVGALEGGDHVEVSIDGLGVLGNPVVRDTAFTAEG
jgi:2-keto-4-pentenoate hydratase/2-oxohepta-3-ene-1,7-dioic acid hydratase in catechol pathway